MAWPLVPLGFVADLSALPAPFPSVFSFPASLSCFFCCCCSGVLAWLGLCFLDGTLEGVFAALRLALASALPLSAFFFLALSALLGFSLALTLAGPTAALLPLGERDFSVGLACFLVGELEFTRLILVLRGMRERELRRSTTVDDAPFESRF